MSINSDQVTPPPPQLARWSTSLLFFLNGTIFATWATRIPAVQAKLMLSTGELGIALLGTACGALAAMNLSGYLAARFGSRSVTVIASTSLCLMLPLLALAPTLPLLVGTLVLFGASNGSMDVAMNAQGVAVERQYGRPILNSFQPCYSLGGLAAVGYAAFSVVIAMGRGVGYQVTARLGPRTMMQLVVLVAAIGLTLALVVTWIPMALLGFGLVGAGFSVVFPHTLGAAGRT